MKDQRDNQTAEPFADLSAFLTDTLAEGAKVSPAARRRIWQQATAPKPSPAPRRRRRPLSRWAYAFTTITIVLGFLGGYVGTVLASGANIPGDPLYELERQVEEVWLTLTPSDQRSEVQLVLLERRIYEAKALLQANREAPPGIFQEIDLLFVAVTEDGLDEAMLLSRLTDYREILYTLKEQHPAVWGLRDALQTANTVIESLGGTPTPLPDPPE
ncbi:MAG: hypothetical protein GVY30_05850 [Chloroflexi bacterium]|jgi:hypothetical protein|nr:hypothetical protein [Chloroflexota bacterium]